MSVTIMMDVWPLDIPPDEKFVLLSCAFMADGTGQCFAGADQIAERCSLEHARCAELIKALIARGLLERNNGRGSWHFRVKKLQSE